MKPSFAAKDNDYGIYFSIEYRGKVPVCEIRLHSAICMIKFMNLNCFDAVRHDIKTITTIVQVKPKDSYTFPQHSATSL
jgi:hypothetical protein